VATWAVAATQAVATWVAEAWAVVVAHLLVVAALVAAAWVAEAWAAVAAMQAVEQPPHQRQATNRSFASKAEGPDGPSAFLFFRPYACWPAAS
jgi:hypothetical protein